MHQRRLPRSADCFELSSETTVRIQISDDISAFCVPHLTTSAAQTAPPSVCLRSPTCLVLPTSRRILPSLPASAAAALYPADGCRQLAIRMNTRSSRRLLTAIVQRPDGPAPTNPAGNGSNVNGGNQNSFGPPPQLTSSASLYLYTFLESTSTSTSTPSPTHTSKPSMSSLTRIALIVIVVATIVLLLLVSITIVARSYALRRRQQAMIAEAIANGTYVPPKKPGVGEKPKMYEIYIGDEETQEQGGGGEPSVEKEKEKERFGDELVVDWDRIMPVACRWLNAPDNSQNSAPTATADSGPTPTPAAATPRRLSLLSLSTLSRLRMSGSGHDQAPSPVPPPSEPTTSPTADRSDPRFSLLSTEKPPLTPEPPEEKVRVSVLISMPFADPSRKRKSMASALTSTSTSTSASAAESELPYVELGTTEVSAGSLRSSLEVPAAFSSDSAARAADVDERRADPPPAAGSYMNV